MTSKKYRFFYHYFRHSEKKLSVHFRGTCYNVDMIKCQVPCETKFNKRQPKLVMQGYATKILINSYNYGIKRTAYII
jgi:hypothetical protein